MIAFMVRYDLVSGERAYSIFLDPDQAARYLDDCNGAENVAAVASYKWDGALVWDWTPYDFTAVREHLERV